MNLLYLGTAQRRLFAIHEAAAPTARRTRAVVLCQPWGTEYVYAHRSMRQLAVKLAMAGWHTLRFDYYGTGDSAGEESEADFVGCGSDVESAMEALADIAGTTEVTLIGLRAGANIAAGVAARRLADVAALVLWDPLAASGELRALAGILPERTAMFVTDSEQSLQPLLQMEFAAGSTPATMEFVPTQCPWLESATTSGMLPVPVIQRVIEWLR